MLYLIPTPTSLAWTKATFNKFLWYTNHFISSAQNYVKHVLVKYF